MLFCWKSSNGVDKNTYCFLEDICEVAGIQSEPSYLQDHFGIGKTNGCQKPVIQSEGMMFLSKKFPNIIESLPNWVLVELYPEIETLSSMSVKNSAQTQQTSSVIPPISALHQVDEWATVDNADTFNPNPWKTYNDPSNSNR